MNKPAWSNAIILFFIVVQALDGGLTYIAFYHFGLGIEIEANPLIVTLIRITGIGSALVLVKIVAVGFGCVLHIRNRHGVILGLSLIYLAASLIPWTFLLAVL